MELKVSDITAVVCARNEEHRIEECLLSLSKARVGEIIVVDGRSSDGTVSKAKETGLCDMICYDEGKGLGAARNVGVRKSSKKYILNFGVDNKIDFNNLNLMLNEFADPNIAGVSAVTIVQGSTYIQSAMKIYKLGRFYPEKRAVIGTPTLFEAELLKKFEYDESRVYSDDAELCHRISQKTGKHFIIANAQTTEFGDQNLSDVIGRWKLYGLSDYEVYTAESVDWNFTRKVRSLLHPIREELFKPIRKVGFLRGLYFAPFGVFITMVRYIGWLGSAIKLNR